ncbi:MAG: GNAT family N-acetyltransferase [Candidatus Aminicenantales bacterium]
MNCSTLKIRNYSSADKKLINSFFQEIAENHGFAGDVSLTSLRKGIKKPGYFPQRHLFLAEEEGRISGLANLDPELRIKRVILSGYIHPSSRGKGIGFMLLEHATRRAREMGAEAIHVSLSDDDSSARNFLLKNGFSPVRVFITLRLVFSQNRKTEFSSETDKYSLTFLEKGEEKKLARLQNSCFAGSWGFSPNTPREIEFWFRITGTSFLDVIVKREGKRIVGYCWTQMIPSEGRGSFSLKRGRIHMIGVHPSYRNRGIGRALLSAGISCLKRKGAESVELISDEENTTAGSLYFSSGFSPLSTTIWYEKRA